MLLPFTHRPILGPRMMIAGKASHPPIECTTTDPAKSWKGAPEKPFIQPWNAPNRPQTKDSKKG
jgi:hypothetical protein